MTGTDVNDLAAFGGESAVRERLGVVEFPVAPVQPAVPVEKLATMTIEVALQRFSLALPDAKVWDAVECKLLKQRACQAWWGKELFTEWMNHPDRASVQQAEVLASAAAAQAKGDGELGKALGRYIYLYGSQDVWDVVERTKIPISVLKVAIASVYDEWVKHPRRRQIRHADLVFNPGGPWEQAGKINTFRGLPLKPADDMDACRHIRALIWHLCNEDNDDFTWLVRWLALPLKKLGTKLATAVIMHSDVQGSGKSLLFDVVMTGVYGEYATVCGQAELESQYTDWSSGKLYSVFEEIATRQEKYNNTGKVKHMITGKTHRIQQKYVSSWEESNHMNCSILSNEINPHPVEPLDRRMMVVWPRKKLSDELRWGVLSEVENGGLRAFYGWLQKVDIGDFHSHTEPPMNEAKQRLIDFGRAGWDLFYRDWKAGELDVPYLTCLVNDLYRVYRQWSHAAGEKSVASREKFSAFISSKERRIRDAPYWLAGGGQDKHKGTFFMVGDPPEGKLQSEWLGECVAAFRKCMKEENQ